MMQANDRANPKSTSIVVSASSGVKLSPIPVPSGSISNGHGVGSGGGSGVVHSTGDSVAITLPLKNKVIFRYFLIYS